MRETKVETMSNQELGLASEGRSRVAERGHRLLTMLAAGFVFLALCLMLVDFRRLDHAAPRHEIYNKHGVQVRPVQIMHKLSPR
jgi:hypothetical protein